ncbi:ArsR/SmtB family transcription factor [Halorussus amylolyticus]|uniref:ArsR/SmtB family transcription factor n=1 Tax=Halorussus amylolyticus TaxID=1126242 RepID=UPI001051AB40|nr:winged helix-turn-helix domain-containing protein [Halorussus amylolyticus]
MTQMSGDRPGDGTYTQASPFVRLLKTPSRVKIIDVLLGKHYEELTTQEIADLAGIDRSSVTRNIRVLQDADLVEQSGKVGNAPQYQLNKESEVSKALGKAQASLLSHSQEIPDQGSTGEIPFDPEEVHLKDHSSSPRVLREKIDPIDPIPE